MSEICSFHNLKSRNAYNIVHFLSWSVGHLVLAAHEHVNLKLLFQAFLHVGVEMEHDAVDAQEKAQDERQKRARVLHLSEITF
jgi:putative Ca2+/H+ antiporter (TMEM165/GDT1 family)